jgi:hypothetical protein
MKGNNIVPTKALSYIDVMVEMARKQVGSIQLLGCSISCSAGWGFVLRAEGGNVISSGYGKLDTVLEPLHAEISLSPGVTTSSLFFFL